MPEDVDESVYLFYITETTNMKGKKEGKKENQIHLIELE